MEARIQLRDQLANLGSAFEAQVRAIPFEQRGRPREAAHRFAHQLLRIVAEEEVVEASENRLDGQLGLFATHESLDGARAAYGGT